MTEEKLLRQEVDELTAMLRGEKQFSKLRKALAVRGIDVSRSVLGGFFEDEEGGEYGLIVTKDKAVSFKRNTNSNKIEEWREAVDASEFSKRFRAAKVAQQIINEQIA